MKCLFCIDSTALNTISSNEFNYVHTFAASLYPCRAIDWTAMMVADLIATDAVTDVGVDVAIDVAVDVAMDVATDAAIGVGVGAAIDAAMDVGIVLETLAVVPVHSKQMHKSISKERLNQFFKDLNSRGPFVRNLC